MAWGISEKRITVGGGSCGTSDWTKLGAFCHPERSEGSGWGYAGSPAVEDDLGTIDGLGRDVRSLVAALLGMTKFDVSRSR